MAGARIAGASLRTDVTPLDPSAITAVTAAGLIMTDEKRKHGRLPLVMEASWEGSGTRSAARTVDISVTGCFIDTQAVVAVDDTLNLELGRDGEMISVQGKVMYQQPGLGFGVQFTRISDADRLRLDALLNPKLQTRRTG